MIGHARFRWARFRWARFRWARLRWASLVLGTLAVPAQAHGNLPGGGGFASGFAHPFAAIEQALAIGALGLLCGCLGRRAAAGWLILGMTLGLGLSGATLGLAQAAIAGLAMLTGLILASALSPPPLAVMMAALVLGLLVGLQTDRPVTTLGPIMAYGGAITAAALLFLNGMAVATWLGARGNHVALRIAGAWIAAAAMLFLAFLFRDPAGIS